MSFCISSYQCPYVCLSAWCANLYFSFNVLDNLIIVFSTCKWQTPASFHTIPFLPLVADINIVTEVAVLFSQSSKGIAIFLKFHFIILCPCSTTICMSLMNAGSHLPTWTYYPKPFAPRPHLPIVTVTLQYSLCSPCLNGCCSSCSRGALANNCPPSVWLPSGLVSFFPGPSRLWLLFISASWYIVIYLLIVSSQEAVDLWGNCRIFIGEDLHVVNA